MSDWFPPQEPAYGRDCIRCYAPDLTPESFGVSISGVQRGDLWHPGISLPPNGWYPMTQHPVINCNWQPALPPPYECFLAFEAGRSTFICQVDGFIFGFANEYLVNCVLFYENMFVTPVGNWFWGGTAQIIPAWEVQEWIEKVTPVIDPDPLLKIVSMPNNRAVVSYIDRWGDTKMKILIDRSP